jgi:glycosyltransferase involved in cell wall biosynthesis
MLVSIIINCFNGEKYLKQCIQSVIEQTYVNWEIIFWDNQSTDNSKNIINAFNDSRIKYFYASTHETLYSARNFAIEKANGQLVAFLDTDDIWLPLKLERQVQIFNDKSVGVVCSNYFVLDEINNKSYLQYKKRNINIKTNDLLKNYNVGLLTLIIRKSYLLTLEKPYFNYKYNIIGDFELVMKLSVKCSIVYINEALAKYRKHNNNISFLQKDKLSIEFKEWAYSSNNFNQFASFKNFSNIISMIYYYESLSFIRQDKKIKILNKNLIKLNLKHLLFLIVHLIISFKLIKLIFYKMRIKCY